MTGRHTLRAILLALHRREIPETEAGEAVTWLMRLPEFQALARTLASERAATEGIRPQHLPTVARLYNQLERHCDETSRVAEKTTWHFEDGVPAVVRPDGHLLFHGIAQETFDVKDVRVVGDDFHSVDESVCVRSIWTDRCMYPVPCPSAVLPIGPTDLRVHTAERVHVEVVNSGHEPVLARVSVKGKTETGLLVGMWCEAVLPKTRRFVLPAGQPHVVVLALSPDVYMPCRLWMKSDSRMDVVVSDVRCGNRMQLPVGDSALPVELFAEGYDIRMDTLAPGVSMSVYFRNEHKTEDRYVEIDVDVKALRRED